MYEKIETRPLCLSSRRKAVLVALYRLARPWPWGLGYPPTIMELMHEVGGRSTSTVWLNLDALWGLGLVHRPEAVAYFGGVARCWRPKYERLQYVTQDGVTTVREIETVAESVCREP